MSYFPSFMSDLGPWARNFFQMAEILEREQMETIKRPYSELCIHVTYKTAELGCVLGGTLFKPIYYYLRTRVYKDMANKKAWRRGRQLSVYPMLAGLALGPVLTFFYVTGRRLNEADVRERCYRLRYNRRQLYQDRTVTWCAGIGLIWRLHGVVTWVNVAFLHTTFYNTFQWDRVTRMVRDYDEDISPKALRKFQDEVELNRLGKLPEEQSFKFEQLLKQDR